MSHQTSRMELLLAGTTSFLWQGVVGAVNNRETDHAVLDALEALIDVVLPQSQALHYAAILTAQTMLLFFYLLIPANKNTRHFKNT